MNYTKVRQNIDRAFARSAQPVPPAVISALTLKAFHEKRMLLILGAKVMNDQTVKCIILRGLLHWRQLLKIIIKPFIANNGTNGLRVLMGKGAHCHALAPSSLHHWNSCTIATNHLRFPASLHGGGSVSVPSRFVSVSSSSKINPIGMSSSN